MAGCRKEVWELLQQGRGAQHGRVQEGRMGIIATGSRSTAWQGAGRKYGNYCNRVEEHSMAGCRKEGWELLQQGRGAQHGRVQEGSMGIIATGSRSTAWQG